MADQRSTDRMAKAAEERRSGWRVLRRTVIACLLGTAIFLTWNRMHQHDCNVQCVPGLVGSCPLIGVPVCMNIDGATWIAGETSVEVE